MRKSIASRIKITKTGKILRRSMGQGHFRAKKDHSRISDKRRMRTIDRNVIKKHI